MNTDPHRRLLIPVETLSRELDAKLLLACYAAEQGFSVILGSKRVLHQRIERLSRAIYIGKSLSAPNIGIYAKLHSLGFSIASTDEEGIVYFSPENYRKEKLCRETVSAMDLLLAWGDENKKLWQNYAHYDGTPIRITGNPRTDLLRPELRPYWDNDVKELHRRFGKYILLNSNFGKVNHYRPDRAEQMHAYQAMLASPEKPKDFDSGLGTYRFQLFQKFKEMARAIADSFPKHTLIIRPHPSESHEVWRQATTGHRNVQILHEGNIIPWLLGAEAIIHNGCTTGIEGYILGKPVIAYQPITDERFDLKLPNTISYRADDLNALRDLIDAAISGSLSQTEDTAGRRRQLIGRHIAALDGDLASERVIGALTDFSSMATRRRALSPSEYGKSLVAGAYTRARYRLKPWTKGRHKRQRYAYQEHIFPDIPSTYIESKITRLQEMLGRFSNVQVKGIKRKIFSLENKYL